MTKFKGNNRDQLFLMPPSINDWLDDEHIARFIVEGVQALDLSSFYKAYDSSRGGQPAYDPAMMVALLIYAYTTGVMSSRKIERATWDDVAFRYIAVNLHPDHDTIANFRRKHAADITQVFANIVQIALKAGIIRLGHVAIDGTKIRANASRECRKTRRELQQEHDRIRRQFGDLLNLAEKADSQEDDENNPNNGYKLPVGLKSKQARLEAIQAHLEELSKQEAEENEADSTGAKRRAWEAKAGKPYERKINTTDPDSRTMLFRNNVYDQGYNPQIAVDDDHGIIVAADVSQDSGDKQNLLPMVLQIESNTGWLPSSVTADAGYFNEKQMKDPRVKAVDFYVKPRKKAVTGKLPKSLDFCDLMRERMEDQLGRTLYKLRMTLVEPAFGAIKQARGFRQFKLRRLQGVRCEWALICIAHNLKKMFRVNPSFQKLFT